MNSSTLNSLDEIILSDKESFIISNLKVPDVSEITIEKNRSYCSENKCGNYGKCWTCPPNVGSPEECIDQLKDYDNVAMIVKEFKNTNPHDVDGVKSLSNEFHELMRNAKHVMSENYDVLALADGPCSNCPKCAFPSPCPCPEEMIPSVSGYGIDMDKFVKDAGLDFGFSDTKVTLYGLLFYKERQTQ